MGSRKDRRVLRRLESALQRDDTRLTGIYAMFAKLADEPIPRVELLARRAVVLPLAELVLALGVALAIAAITFAASVSPACRGLAYYPKAQLPPAVSRSAPGHQPVSLSCQPRSPAQPRVAG